MPEADTYWNIAQSVLGFLDAKKASGNDKDSWRAQNPSIYNPFGSIETSWNRGKPTSTQTFTPELQSIIDSLIMNPLTDGRAEYGMPDQVRDLYGAQTNWQRERFGLPPAESNPTPYGNKEGGNPNFRQGGESTPSNPDSIDGGEEPEYVGTGTGGIDNEDALGRIVDEVTNRDLSQGNLTGGGGSGYNDQFNYTGKNQTGGNVGRDGRYNVGDIAGAFENGYATEWDENGNPTAWASTGNQMYKDQGGYGMSWIADNAENLGRAFSLATGLPFGGVAGKEFQNWVYDNYDFQSGMNDGNTNPDTGGNPYNAGRNNPDPYGLSDRPVGESPAMSGMNDGITNPTTMFGRGNFGRYGSQGGYTPITPDMYTQEGQSPYAANPNDRGGINREGGYNNSGSAPDRGYAFGGSFGVPSYSSSGSITGGGAFPWATHIKPS